MIAASARKRLHDRRDAVSEILISCRFLDHRRIAQRGRDDMRGAPVERASHTRALLDSGSLAPRRRRQDSLFFSCAVVISVQCSSIRDCTASPVSSMARRAEWRRSQSRRRNPLRRRPHARPRSGGRRRRSNASSAQASSIGEDGLHNRRGRRSGAMRRGCLAGSSRRRRASAKSRLTLRRIHLRTGFRSVDVVPEVSRQRKKAGGGVPAQSGTSRTVPRSLS